MESPDPGMSVRGSASRTESIRVKLPKTALVRDKIISAVQIQLIRSIRLIRPISSIRSIQSPVKLLDCQTCTVDPAQRCVFGDKTKLLLRQSLNPVCT
jgi:hypothetical protein